MTGALLLGNAELVLADRVARGWVAVADGCIAGIGEGAAPAGAEDLGGDHLLPGLVELHTDHLEAHFIPRPKVHWPALAAAIAYDAQLAACGITTVFDSLRAGTDPRSAAGEDLDTLVGALAEGTREGLFRAEHRLHLRCELPSPDVVEAARRVLERHGAGLLSVMDHTPGQRQWRDMERYVTYTSRTGKPEAQIRADAARKIAEGGPVAAANRPLLAALAREFGIPLAAHDDTTEQDVAESVADGATLAEFPTSVAAAAASRAAGMAVVMGAPNLIRGGSHSGNVAAERLAREGLLDILSSDYVPASLLMAAFALPQRVPGLGLPAAVATVTRNPARAAGLTDRGTLAPGLRADLVRVRLAGEVPVVRQTWREGRRVA